MRHIHDATGSSIEDVYGEFGGRSALEPPAYINWDDDFNFVPSAELFSIVIPEDWEGPDSLRVSARSALVAAQFCAHLAAKSEFLARSAAAFAKRAEEEFAGADRIGRRPDRARARRGGRGIR